jgi:thioredoxin reductase (NADPH)
MSSFEVIVYSSTGCPYCEKVKNQLTEWGIEYEVRNVSIHKEFFDELRTKKVFGTPATYVNGKLILGYQEKKFKKAFGMEETDEETTESTKKEVTVEDEIFEKVDQDVLAEVYDFVMIGGGPAGASAAVYAARAKLKSLVIDKAPKAGTLALTHKIANYPGIRESVTGLELLTRMQVQAKDFGAKFVRSNVISVDFSKEIKEITVAEGVVKAKTVFVAVGAKAPASKIIGEEEFIGRGVSYCSTCDAAFYEDKRVVVVGDNEEAIHEAASLAKFCKEVRVLIPSGIIRGEVDLASIESEENVVIFKKHRIKEIIGEDNVEKVVVVDGNREEHEWNIDGVFLYLAGMKPGTDFLKDVLPRDEEGYVIVDDHLRTNIPGVYAGGDARKTPIKQAVISAADGAIAALGADQYVNRRTKLRPQY